MSKSVQTIEKTSKSIKGLLLFSGAAMIFGLVEAIRYASTNAHIANLAWSTLAGLRKTPNSRTRLTLCRTRRR